MRSTRRRHAPHTTMQPVDAEPTSAAVSRGFVALTVVLVAVTAGSLAKLAIDGKRDNRPLTAPATLGGVPRIEDPPVTGRTSSGGLIGLGQLGGPVFAGTSNGRAAVTVFYGNSDDGRARNVTMLSAVRGRVDADQGFRALLAGFGGLGMPVQRTIGRTRCGLAVGERGTVCLRTGERLSVFVFGFETTDLDATARLAEEAHAAMR